MLKLAFASQSDVTFFRLQEGKLRFEGLHFLLEAHPAMAGPLAFFRIGDNVQAVFDRCAFTLKANASIPVSIVALIDAKERMMAKSDVPSPGSRVQFVNSFIRGDGDLANLCSCRRLTIGLDNSLVALAGSLFDLDVKSDEMATEQGPQIELKRTTVFCRAPIFSLNSTRAGKGLGRTHVEASGCLFAALAKRPLMYLKAPDVQNESQLTKYIEWKGEQNAYARFENLLESERPDEMGRAMELSAGAWGKQFEPQTGQSDIALPSLSDVVLTQVRPDDLRPTSAEAPNVGAGSLTDLPLPKALEPR